MAETDIPNNTIYYTTLNGQICEPYRYDALSNDFQLFGATIVSNTYENGQGIITFEGDIAWIKHQAFSQRSCLTSINIPNSVTNIEEEAFSGCSGLTSIAIPNSVKSIGDGTFSGCSGLTSIIIPNSVTNIGHKAFSNCSNLTSLDIPNSVISIGQSVFKGCIKLNSINIPNGLSIIEHHVFADCSGLTTINIPSSVTCIRDNAFEGCSSLTSIKISNSVTSIGKDVFSGTGWWSNQPEGLVYLDSCLLGYKGNKPYGSIYVEEGTRIIAKSAFSDCNGLTSAVLPNSVTNIGDDAFNGCNRLASINISDNMTNIGNSAFGGCSQLTSIDIPNSVTNIGASAFYRCSKLTSINISNSVKSIGDGAFYGTGWWDNQLDGLVYLNNYLLGYKGESPSGTINIEEGTIIIADNAFYSCPELSSVSIPSSVTSIGNSAFEYCSGLSSINIPNSVTSIGQLAFARCPRLTSINIPNRLSIIEYGVFQNCSGLTSINVPNSVTSIGKYAFSCCSSLSSINIPNSVVSIGDRTFQECSSLNYIIIPSNVAYIGQDAFYKTNIQKVIFLSSTPPNNIAFCAIPSCQIYIPVGSKDIYSSIPNWKYKLIYEGGIVDNMIFRLDNKCLTVVGLIGDGINIEELTIPSITELNGITYNVSGIAGEAFMGSTALVRVSLPNSIEEIGSCAFQGCTNLKTVTLSKNITNISYGAFQNCTSLESVDILVGTITVEDYAFDGCASLTTVTMKDYVTSIGEYCFCNCVNLSSITLSKSIESIGKYAFDGCVSIRDVTIPATCASIYPTTFNGCTKLKSFTVDSSNIYYSTLDGVLTDKNQTQIVAYPIGKGSTYTIPASISSIGENSFRGSELTSISIPASVSTIYNYAFADCDKLGKVIFENGLSSISLSNYIFQNSALQDVEIYRLIYNNKSGSYTPFYGCTTLKTAILGNKVTHIYPYMFYGCTALISVELGEYITSIGSWAFGECSSLESIKIPETVETIEDNFLYGCSGLKEIKAMMATPPTLQASAFYGIDKNLCKLLVPAEYVGTYSETPGWMLFNNIVEMAPEVPCTSIVLDNNTATINVGKTVTLTATLYPDDATVKNIEWSSSNTAVATVADGIVTAVGLGTATITATTTDGSNLSVTCSVTVAPESTPLDIIDDMSDAFEITTEKQYETVNYSRNFTDNNWQPLYIPFEMTYDEWTAEGLEIVRLNGFYQYDDDEDGKIDRSVLEVIKVKEGKLLPNYPYLVKSNTIGEKKITLKNKTVYCTESNSVDCSTVATTYTFTGTYATKCDLASNGCYYMKDGDIVLAENAEESVPAFSWYLTAENRKYYSNTPKFKKIKLRVIGEDYRLGDPNNDRYIDIGDYTTIANYILGTIGDTFIEKAADVNCDGDINVGDLTAEANLILYGDGAAQTKPRYAANDEALIYINDTTMTAGESVDLSVKMKNDVPMTGFQFDVVMPEGLSIAMDEDGYYCIDLSTERTTTRNTNTFDSALQADGSVRVLAGSTKSKTFEGTDGEVCTITVKAAESISDGTYTIVLKNIIMSDATGKTYKVDRSEATVTIDSATGITAIGTKALNGKYMKDGKLTILRNGKKYTAVGMEE